MVELRAADHIPIPPEQAIIDFQPVGWFETSRARVSGSWSSRRIAR